MWRCLVGGCRSQSCHGYLRALLKACGLRLVASPGTSAHFIRHHPQAYLLAMSLTNWHFACKWQWAALKSVKVCSSSWLYFLSSRFLDKNSQYLCFLVYNFSTAKCNRSRWENLDHGQYCLQPIKFVNLVVPSHCEAKSYQNIHDGKCFSTTFSQVVRREVKIMQSLQLGLF